MTNNKWSDKIAQMKSDLKFHSNSSRQLLAAYNEWCIMNTKIEKGSFAKIAKQFKRDSK